MKMNSLISNRRILACFAVSLFLLSVLLVAVPVKAASTNYDNVSLSGGFMSGNFPQEWDLTSSCDLTLSFTYDANGLVDDFGNAAHAWAELGVRAVGYGNFNPTWNSEGAGVWLATDYDSTANTFDPDPPGAPSQDLDDKLILQKGGGWGEGSYNLPSTPLNPGDNHRVWWDRDGVDPWQNPETANTGGIYPIVITLHATSATTGKAYMTIKGLSQGFETDGNWNTIELTPAGMTFTGDMAHMQVFYGLYGYGATHSMAFKDITVTGCLYEIPATVNVDPDTLNLKSKGNWITAYITLPAGWRVSDIDLDTVYLGGAKASWGEIQGDVLMVKFDRQAFGALSTGSVQLTITGLLTNTQPFTGTDTIRVISK
jgi:hypothetical protein